MADAKTTGLALAASLLGIDTDRAASVTVICAACWSGACGFCGQPCECRHDAPRRLVAARPGQVR